MIYLEKALFTMLFPFIYVYYKWKMILLVLGITILLFAIDFIIWNYTKKSLYHKIKKILGF